MTAFSRRAGTTALVAGISALLLTSVLAQDAHKGHGSAAPAAPAAQAPAAKADHMKAMHEKHKSMMGSGGMMQPAGDVGPSSQAFNAINSQMHKAMAIAFTGDADVDFARAMIPHHQGAIDMAKVVLGFGKDPEIRKLAESVIKAQEAEIAQMDAWLKAKGK